MNDTNGVCVKKVGPAKWCSFPLRHGYSPAKSLSSPSWRSPKVRPGHCRQECGTPVSSGIADGAQPSLEDKRKGYKLRCLQIFNGPLLEPTG